MFKIVFKQYVFKNNVKMVRISSAIILNRCRLIYGPPRKKIRGGSLMLMFNVSFVRLCAKKVLPV